MADRTLDKPPTVTTPEELADAIVDLIIKSTQYEMPWAMVDQALQLVSHNAKVIAGGPWPDRATPQPMPAKET